MMISDRLDRALTMLAYITVYFIANRYSGDFMANIRIRVSANIQELLDLRG